MDESKNTAEDPVVKKTGKSAGVQKNKISGRKIETKMEVSAEEQVLEREVSGDSKQKYFKVTRFLPNAVTIAAMCFGLSAIRFALSREWEYAVLCVFISSLLDMCDGKVARFFGQSSPFGVQLDSLSDLVCFGVAPTVILYLISMSYVGKAGWAICMFYAVCCAMRLARFNVSHGPDVQISDLDKKYFTGVPAPAGAILSLFPMILFFTTERLCFVTPTIIACSLFVSGVLMISTVKTISSKMLEVDKANAWMALTCIALIVICLVTDLWLALSMLIGLYVILIPIGAYMYTSAVSNQQKIQTDSNKNS